MIRRLPRGMWPKPRWSQLSLRWSLSKAQVGQAKAALEMAETNLRYATIRSPVNGTVISRNVDVGQTVAASLQAPTIFTIAKDLTKMQVDTNVSEADVGRITVGQDSTFTVDAYPEGFFVEKFQRFALLPLSFRMSSLMMS